MLMSNPLLGICVSRRYLKKLGVDFSFKAVSK
jgi:hypothetical protein